MTVLRDLAQHMRVVFASYLSRLSGEHASTCRSTPPLTCPQRNTHPP